jgi:hypothetical protein
VTVDDVSFSIVAPCHGRSVMEMWRFLLLHELCHYCAMPNAHRDGSVPPYVHCEGAMHVPCKQLCLMHNCCVLTCHFGHFGCVCQGPRSERSGLQSDSSLRSRG